MPVNWIYAERSAEIAAVVAHSFLSVIVIAIVLISCVRKTKAPCVYLRFYGHTMTFILAFITMIVQMFEVLEGILIDVRTSSVRPFLHASNVLAVIAVVFLLVLFHFAERQCCGAYVLLILMYWSATAVIYIADIALLNSDSVRLAKDSAKLFLVGLASSLCFLQVILNVVILFKQGIRRKTILASSQSKKDGEDPDLAAIEYVHRYVSFPSKILFDWFNKILLTGFKKCLTLNDLGPAPRMESSEFNFRKLKALFEEEKKLSFERNKPVSLSRCFWRLTKPMMLLGGTFKIVSDILLYTPILCLDAIISFLIRWESHNSTEMRKTEWIGNESYSAHSLLDVYEFFTNGYVLILICFFIQVFQMTLFQHHLFLAVREGIRCKCALQSLVFDKSLRLYVSDINEGKLMNHMTVDPLHIVMIFMFFHSIWTMPVQVLVGLILLYLQLGTSALISGLLILTMVIVQYLVGKRLGVVQEKILKQADERLKKSNEMLQSIKLLKLYAWERIFYQSVIATRTKELRLMLTAAILRVFSIAVTDGVPYFACLLTFTLYHYMETEPLNPGKVFSGLALFSIFGGQLFLIILMIYVASQAMASVNRLRDFLLLPEIPTLQLPTYQVQESSPTSLDGSHSDKVVNGNYSLALRTLSEPSHSLDGLNVALSVPSSDLGLNGFAIEISNGNFSFSGRQLLHDIFVKIPAGKLTMVTGSVGSGKSSLLWAMLGEMSKMSGEIVIRGRSIAFVAQKSWIINSTVSGNILFGLPFDPMKYQNVIEASGLGPDLQMFPAGDQTEIGEKGANLSGGQRQRVSIARALYADSDIYLMDDPLSALDAQVGLHIFEEVIMKALIGRGKTVVLVTHHVQYLPRAHHLIVLHNGRIFYEGTPGDVSSRPGLLSPSRDRKMFSASRTSLEHDRESFHHISHRAAVSAGIKAAVSFSTLSILSEEMDYSDASQKMGSPGKELAPEISEAGRLIEEEEVSTGAVSYRYFVAYFRAATFLLSGLAVSFYATRLSVRLYADYWLTLMVDASVASKSVKTNGTSSQSEIGGTGHRVEHNVEYYLTIYSILSVITIIFVPLGSISLEMTVLTASRNLHQQMLQRIVSAPLRFFDTNPIGRIVNRLAADMNVIDEKLTIVFDSFLFCSLAVFGGIIINCVFVPYFLVPVAPIVVLFVFIQRFCIASCRELQRIDCSTKSPILAHFSQMLAGISTIRAYRCEERFQLENFEKVDSNNVAFLFFHSCHLWLGLRLDYLASLLVLFACLSAAISCQLGTINSSTVGFVVSYALMICSLMNWTMRNLSEMEVYFGSVERIIQYSVIESEPYEESRGELPPKEWPSAGEITFESVSLKYSPELDPVVHEFTLHIEPGSKVGICGRTGSGKSSMTLSLFRMVYISNGRILLDGFNISDVPLELLRSKISIIPQEPVLFSGTVRFNLDPLQTKNDEEIWKALEIAQLNDLVLKLPQQLDMQVTEGGDNFSIGQRQMFCLARALLRDSKILVMDEATASIDSETDLQIQKIVKRAFAQCTVITIAHRLSTILNCDLIIVLRDGRKIEEGKPKDLIRANGVFAQMLTENRM